MVPRLQIDFANEERSPAGPLVPFQLNAEQQKEESVDEQLEEMIGSLPTIRTEKDENRPDE